MKAMKTHLPGRAGRTVCGHPTPPANLCGAEPPTCKMCARLATPRGEAELHIRGLSPDVVNAFKEYMVRHGHRTMAAALADLLDKATRRNL